jgi:uncharacterized membrane protein HdeD (DUF308 family)
MRAMQIITGVLALVLAGIVLISPVNAAVLAAFWLALSLLFGGIEGVITGIWASHLSRGWRGFSIGAGVIAIMLSMAAFAFPGAAALTTIFLFSIALLILGAGGIARGLLEKRLSGWYRAMLVGVGSIALLLSVPVMISPVLVGLPTLYVFASAALVIIGVSYVIAGVSGAVFRPRDMVRSGMGRSWESDAA